MSGFGYCPRSAPQPDEKIAFRSAKGQFYKTKLATNFAAQWTGFLRIEKPADYTLALRSDDGSRLFIGDTLIIDNAKPGPDQVMKDVILAAQPAPVKSPERKLRSSPLPARNDRENGRPLRVITFVTTP